MDPLKGKLMSWVLPVAGDPKDAEERECEFQIRTRTSDKGVEQSTLCSVSTREVSPVTSPSD